MPHDSKTTSDAIKRTKADPNRSLREDELVTEIERLRAEIKAMQERHADELHERECEARSLSDE